MYIYAYSFSDIQETCKGYEIVKTRIFENLPLNSHSATYFSHTEHVFCFLFLPIVFDSPFFKIGNSSFVHTTKLVYCSLNMKMLFGVRYQEYILELGNAF